MSDIDVIIQVHTDGIKKVGDLSASLRNLTNTLRGINVPMSRLDAQSKAVNKALGITSRGVNDHAKSIKNLVQNQKVLSQEQQRVVRELRTLKNAYALSGKETTQLGRNIGITTKELQNFSRTLKLLRIKAFGSDIHNVSLRLSKLGKDAQFVGRSLLINLTLPLATFARVGLQSFRAVDQEMTRLIKVSENLASSLDVAYQKMGLMGEATAEQKARAEGMVLAFEQLNYRLSTLSLNFGVAKEMVTSIAADFAELGITAVENTEKLTLMTLQIEKLGNMDIGPAQDLATALYFQSRRALEVNGALSKLTSARQRETAAINSAKAQMLLFNSIENATALTLKDLGDAFPEVGSAATSFGLSMTEAAAMLAPMKAAGLDVGASANSIKVSLQRLLAPTNQNVEMLNKLAERYGVADDAQNEFTLSTKTGLIGLDATVRMFDRVRKSQAGMEGALRLMSDLFEKRQGPRMYLAIEQLADFNNELAKTEQFANRTIPATASAEIQMARVADEAAKKFSYFNRNVTPDTVRSFKDIGNIARIATAEAGQRLQIEPGKEIIITDKDIVQARAMRKAVSDLILQKRQAEGIDLISEVKTEAGRAMMIQLAGAANAQAVAQQELDRSLETVGVQVDRIKIAFKQFASEIIRRLKPAIEEVSERVVNFLKHWSSPEMQQARERIINLILTLGSFLASMGPVILAIGTFQSVIGNTGKGLSIIFPKLKNVQGEFIGIGRSAKLAATSINDFYEKFLSKSSARATPLTPTPGTGAGVSRPRKPFDRAKVLDDLTKQDIKDTGATPAEISRMKRLRASGLSATGTPRGMGMSTVHRGKAVTLSKAEVAVLRALEARDLASTPALPGGVVPTAGGFAGPTDPVVSQRKRLLRRMGRARDISRISPYLEAAGVDTDEMGTRFLRGGREITEKQARALGRGGVGAVGARAGIAASQAKDTVKGLATAPVKAFKTALDSARAAQAALIAQQAAFGATPGKFRLMATGVMNFVKTLKVAKIAAMAFRTALLFTGIGVIIAAIAGVVFLVIKNLDKIRGSTKAWDKLKAAFDVIKNAALEIVRPIQDLFAAFGGGGNDAEAAGNGVARAFEGIAAAVLFVARIFQIFVKKVVQPLLYGIINIVMAVISLFKGNWQDALKFLIAAFAGVIKGIVNLFIGMAKGLVKIVVGIVNSILNIFSKIPGMGGIVKGIQGAISKVGNTIVGVYDAVGKGITGLLDKGVELGIKKSSNALSSKGKPKFKEAGTEVGTAGNEAITAALGNEEGVEDAAGKLANAIKEGVADAAQKLYDYVVDRMGDAIKKFVSNTVKALQKQKESALKVFDVQINTLAKLEKAEESLTRKKEYETNRRKLIDDATLRGEAYRRNRALAIYEGRIDDARILDLEEQQSAKESQQELTSLDEGRRKELAKENLDALREAINSAKELAGKFFDESLEKFQEAADHITRIAPVTIEQYTAQLAELQTLTTQTADTNNLEFGKMFEKFSTTITEKMPNAVDDFGNALGGFSEPLDQLVLLAQEKYGLGSEDEATVLGVTRKMADSVIGITLGMLVDIGDKFGSNVEPIIEKYGQITSGVVGETGKFKDDVLANFNTLLEQTKTAFLGPYEKALTEAEPTKVFNDAIKDGNQEILNSFLKLVNLNPDLMKRLADSLDPAIKKYIALKAAADAAAEAAANAGSASGATPPDGTVRPGDFTTADRYEDWLRRYGYLVSTSVPNTGPRFRTADDARRANIGRLTRGYKEGGPVSREATFQSTPYGISGFLNAPEQQGIPAILHGGEFVVNADAVKRIGLGALAKLNDPRIPKFKKGGFVGTADRAERMALKQKKDSQFANYATSSVQTYKRVMEQIDTINVAKKQIEEESKKPKVVQIFNSFKKAGSQGLNAALDQIGKIGAQDGLIDKLTRFDSSTVDLLKGGVARTGKIVKGTYDNVVYPMLESYSASFTNPLVNLAGKAIGRNPNLREAGLMETAVNTADIVTTVLSGGLSKAVVEIGEVGLMSSMKALSRGSVKTSSEMLAEKLLKQTTNKVAKNVTKSGIRGIAESAIISPTVPKPSAIVPDFVDLTRKPLALGAGDTTGRFLPESLFNLRLNNPITVRTGERTVLGTSRLDRDLTKTTGKWVRGWMEDITAHANATQQGFLLEGDYFESLPGLLGGNPVGFGFNIGSPENVKKAFPMLPKDTALVQAQPFEILDTALGLLHGGGGLPLRDLLNSMEGARFKMGMITDRFSPSQVDEKAYGFVYDYAHAQAAPNSIQKYLKMQEKWLAKLERDLLFYKENPQFGVKTVDDLWKDFVAYNDVFEGLSLDQFNSFIGKIPRFGENLTPQQIDYIALNAANGNAEAKQMFDQLSGFGKDVRKMHIDSIARGVEKRTFDERLTLGNTFFIREELGEFPMFKLQPDGSMTLHSRSSLTHDSDTRRAIDRHTIHGALNHIVHGGTLGGRPNVTGATFITARVEDMLKYNPGSLNTLLGYDTNFVATPFGSIRIPAGKFDLFKESMETFQTYPGMRDPYIDSIMQSMYRQKHRLESITSWDQWQIMKGQERVYTREYASKLKKEIEDRIILESFYRSSIVGNPMGVDLNKLLEPVMHGDPRGSKTMDFYNYMTGVEGRDSTSLMRDLDDFLYEQQNKYVTDIREGMYGQYLHDYKKVLEYYERLYPELVDKFNESYTSRPIYEMIDAAHPEMSGSAGITTIQKTVTRDALRKKIFGSSTEGNYGAPAVRAGMQEIDHDSQMAFNRIGLSLPDPVIPVFHPDMYAAIGNELPQGSFSQTGIYSIPHLVQVGRNQILRNFASDAVWIQDFLGYFPGKFTRLKTVAQRPWEQIVEKAYIPPDFSMSDLLNQLGKEKELVALKKTKSALSELELVPQTGSLPQLNIASGITGVLDPVLQAKRAAVLQMRGMGGGGAFFNDIPVPRAPLNIPNRNSSQQMLDILLQENNSLALFQSLGRLNARVKSNISMTPDEAFFVDEFTSAFNQILNLRLLDLHNDPIALDAYLQNILKMSINRPGPGVGHPLPFGEGTTPLLERLKASGFGAVFTKFNDVLNNPEIQEIVDMLLRDFARTHKKLSLTVPDDITVFRGLVLPQPSEDPFRYLRHLYAKGSMLPPHYVSTSTNPYVAGNFTGAAGHVNLLEQITLPKGTEVLAPAHWGVGLQNEKELILPPAYRLKIDDMEQTGVLHRIFATAVKTAGAALPIAGAGMMLSDQEKALADFSKNQNPIVIDRMEEKVQKFYSSINQLKEFIAAGESINALDPYSAWAKPGAPGMIMPGMTSMKIGEIINSAQGHAVGKYQNMPPYLLQRAKVAGFNIGTVFSPDVQEAIMLSTLMSSPQDAGIGLTSLLNNRIGINTAVDRVANMWRSMSGTGGKFVGGGINPSGFDPSRKDLVIKSLLEQMMLSYPGFKKGGFVKGATSKAIPAILHGGEYVLNANTVQQLGLPYLNTINQIRQSRFTAPNSRINAPSAPVTNNVSTVNIQVENFIGQEEWFNSMMKEYNVNVLPKNQKLAGLEQRKFTSYNGINQGM